MVYQTTGENAPITSSPRTKQFVSECGRACVPAGARAGRRQRALPVTAEGPPDPGPPRCPRALDLRSNYRASGPTIALLPSRGSAWPPARDPHRTRPMAGAHPRVTVTGRRAHPAPREAVPCVNTQHSMVGYELRMVTEAVYTTEIGRRRSGVSEAGRNAHVRTENETNERRRIGAERRCGRARVGGGGLRRTSC